MQGMRRRLEEEYIDGKIDAAEAEARAACDSEPAGPDCAVAWEAVEELKDAKARKRVRGDGGGGGRLDKQGAAPAQGAAVRRPPLEDPLKDAKPCEIYECAEPDFTLKAAGQLEGALDGGLGTDAPVVVTREQGKNGALLEALAAAGVAAYEAPLVEAVEGPERGALPGALRAGYDWVLVTSPEGAKTLRQGWEEAGRPALSVASLGEGTSRALMCGLEDDPAAGALLRPAFTPTVANAKALAAELPVPAACAPGPARCLYPASAIAGAQLQDSLSARGFQIERLDVYSTAKVTSLSAAALAAFGTARAVAFASPSAVRAYKDVVGETDVCAVCIGSTSAAAAEEAGFREVHFPKKPGLKSWVATILGVVR